VLPWLGSLPVKSIAPVTITPIVEAIVKRGSDETARRVLQHIRKVFKYGVGKGIIATNPAAATHEMLPPTRRIKHRPAITDLDALRGILADADQAPCTEAMRMVSRLIAFSASRIGPAVEAEWREFDLDSPVATWTIPRAKQKKKDRPHDHVVYLGAHFADELRAWRRRTGPSGYLFPGTQGRKFLSREGVEKFYNETLGLADQHSPHSWRTAFSSNLRDRGHERDVVELALDHIKDPNAVLRAYDRGQRTAKRIEAALDWDRLLAGAPTDPSILSLHAKSGAA
jgi:integrase